MRADDANSGKLLTGAYRKMLNPIFTRAGKIDGSSGSRKAVVMRIACTLIDEGSI
jgi:hypothetical protein